MVFDLKDDDKKKADLLFRGGWLIDPALGLDSIGDLAFTDGLISAVAPFLDKGTAEQEIDVSGGSFL